MLNWNEIEPKIDQYLRHELSKDEIAAFEKLIQENEELRNEVKIRFDIMMGIRAAEQKHILEQLEKVDQEQKVLDKNKLTQPAPVSNAPQGYILILLALVALLLLAYFFIF